MLPDFLSQVANDKQEEDQNTLFSFRRFSITFAYLTGPTEAE